MSFIEARLMKEVLSQSRKNRLHCQISYSLFFIRSVARQNKIVIEEKAEHVRLGSVQSEQNTHRC